MLFVSLNKKRNKDKEKVILGISLFLNLSALFNSAIIIGELIRFQNTAHLRFQKCFLHHRVVVWEGRDSMRVEGKWLVAVAVHVYDSDSMGQPDNEYYTHCRVEDDSSLLVVDKDYFSVGNEISLHTHSSKFSGRVTSFYGLTTIRRSLWAGSPVWGDRICLLLGAVGIFEGPARTLDGLSRGDGSPSFMLIPKDGYDEKLLLQTTMSEVAITLQEYLEKRRSWGWDKEGKNLLRVSLKRFSQGFSCPLGIHQSEYQDWEDRCSGNLETSLCTKDLIFFVQGTNFLSLADLPKIEKEKNGRGEYIMLLVNFYKQNNIPILMPPREALVLFSEEAEKIKGKKLVEFIDTITDWEWSVIVSETFEEDRR